MAYKYFGAGVRLIAAMAVVGNVATLTPAFAAAPLTPNPNPSGNTITNNGGQLTNDPGVIFENNGTISNGSSSSSTIDNFATIDNNAGTPNGQIQNGAAGVFNNNLGAQLNNGGAIDNKGIIRNDGTITNSGGAVTIHSSAQLTNVDPNAGTYHQTGGTTQVDGAMRQNSIQIDGGVLFGNGGNLAFGTLSLASGAQISGGGPGAPIQLQGAVTGTGNYTGTVIFSGSLKTGTTGPTTISGESMIFGGGNTLILQLTQSGNDKISASSAVTLGGKLQVILGQSAPALTLGAQFDLIDAPIVTNQDFDQLVLPTLASGLEWDHTTETVNNIAEYLVTVGQAAVAVPEPPAIALWLSGFVAMGAAARRRLRHAVAGSSTPSAVD